MLLSAIEVFKKLRKDFPKHIADIYPFPKVYEGTGKVKAIILGADPTHIIDGLPKELNMVFGLDNIKSPYWNSIGRNIKQLSNISMDNVYVQNVCRNYFLLETSKNENWIDIARGYWCDLLKQELDTKFDKNVPVLITTEFILHSIIKNRNKIKASNIYNECISITKDQNLLSREVLAFYRHPAYSLKNWEKYRIFIDNKLI